MILSERFSLAPYQEEAALALLGRYKEIEPLVEEILTDIDWEQWNTTSVFASDFNPYVGALKLFRSLYVEKTTVTKRPLHKQT